MWRRICPHFVARASLPSFGLASTFAAAVYIAFAIAGYCALARDADVWNTTQAWLAQAVEQPSSLPVEQSVRSLTSDRYMTPQTYGAKGDGVTDDTAVFQSALNAGHLLVPPATYLINGSIYVPSYRNVRCQPGANLHTTRHDGNESGVITFKAVSHSSVVGCTFTGSNTATVPVLDNNQWNYLIWIKGPSHDILVTGNTLKYSWANSALHIDGNEGNPNIPSTGILVTYNNFLSNGYYGVAIISANNVQVLHNYLVDSSCCAEANSPITDQSKYNVYAYNYMTSVHGNGANRTACTSGIFFTGGEAPNNFDYGTVQVYGNYIVGNNTRLITGANSGSTPPVYTNNQCIKGCKEQ